MNFGRQHVSAGIQEVVEGDRSHRGRVAHGGTRQRVKGDGSSRHVEAEELAGVGIKNHTVINDMGQAIGGIQGVDRQINPLAEVVGEDEAVGAGAVGTDQAERGALRAGQAGGFDVEEAGTIAPAGGGIVVVQILPGGAKVRSGLVEFPGGIQRDQNIEADARQSRYLLPRCLFVVQTNARLIVWFTSFTRAADNAFQRFI